jgi:hypothetical protein
MPANEFVLAFDEEQEEIEPIEPTGQDFVEYQPTEEQRKLVKNLAIAGAIIESIRRRIVWPGNGKPVSLGTLYKHFRKELSEGHDEMMVNVSGALYNEGVVKRNVTALIFLAKTRGGPAYSERQHIEMTGKDGAPLQTNSGVLVVPGPLDSADWEAFARKQQADLADETVRQLAELGNPQESRT